jgi:Ca2+-binding RTX toxin-like protein
VRPSAPASDFSPALLPTVLRGGASNDFLAGGDGDDRLDGGPGKDILSGGEGRDVIAGGAGDDQLHDSFDFLDSTTSNDTDANPDLFDGGAGEDRVYFPGPQDVIRRTELDTQGNPR